jgi:transposase
MAKKRKAQPEARRPKGLLDGQRTYAVSGKRIVSHTIGALPIVNRLLERMQLKRFLTEHLPHKDKRTKIDAPRVVLLLVRNLLVSRDPMYGVAEWARNYGPECFDIWPEEFDYLNDDRLGRCLEQVFEALETNLIMDVVTHVVTEFQLSLDELHNDSTTISFFGDYPDAAAEQVVAGQTVPAITWGHNKDHRPDLKQLLYILTVTEDGGVPVYFQAASGNVVDDATHQETWKLMAQLVQRPDFVYVADCKLASTANLNEIARQGGRFITVLPATRKEDTQFRRTLRDEPNRISWEDLYELTDEDGNLLDAFRVCSDEMLSKEGYRLLWFHSRGKVESDAATRTRRLQRAMRELTDLRDRLSGPRTRLRNIQQVQKAVDASLNAHETNEFLQVDIQEQEEVTHHQNHRGRQTSKTKYIRRVKKRVTLTWKINAAQLDLAVAGDGVFPLITNIRDWSATDILQAYKRQPIIEKRFSQLKTDFRVAPVYLKNVRRIVGLLAIYFFVLMVQSLLERELRNAMDEQQVESLPLYPEGRACVWPTTRQVIDTFAPIARHSIQQGREFEIFNTELATIHRTILKLFKIKPSEFFQ